MARIIWRIVQASFNISLPVSIFHMFNGWLNGINKELMYKILVGASAVCWAIWLSRNDMVFNSYSFAGNIPRDTLDPLLGFAAEGERATSSYSGVPCA